MALTTAYPHYDQPDVARVTAYGVTYTCHVWQRPGALAIIAAIFVELEDGGHTLIDGPIVVTAQTDRAFEVECPKVIGRMDGSDGYFILHALETETDGTGSIIYRWIFDLTAIASGWQAQGATATTHPDGLYDVDVVHGSDSDFVLAHKNVSGTEISFGRWEAPWATASTVWLQTDTLECESRVLTVWASDDFGTDGGVYITRQMDDGGASPNELHTYRVDADDGSSNANDQETFGSTRPINGSDTNEHLQVRIVQATSTRLVVMTEALTVDDRDAEDGISPYGRYVAWVPIREDAGTVAPAQHIAGVSLHGGWQYASGVALTNNVYALVGFKNMADGHEYGQMTGIVVDLDYLETIAAAEAGTVEAKPVATFNDGSFDARISGNSPVSANVVTVGSRRMNHISHTARPPQYATGPKLKSVVTAGVAWEYLMPVRDTVADVTELHPTQSSIRAYEFHHEDPWFHRRDSSEPAAPSGANVKCCAPWSIGQGTDLGEFLHFTGGVQHVYAGERLVELGFLWAPEIISLALNGSTADGAGFTNDGVYYYTATYAWRDEHGHLHRSGPADPVAITQAADAEGVNVQLRTMTLSMKDRALDIGVRPVSIEIWRTYYEDGAAAEDGGTFLFRRVFCQPGVSGAGLLIGETPINDRDEWCQTVTDGSTDANVAVAELLPWQLDTSTLAWNLPTPVPPSACTVACVWNNRLWVVPSEHQDQIRYSKEIETLGTQQIAPEFNDVNVYRLDNRGPITGMVPMDNALAVFTRDSIMLMTGDGNDGTGANGSLQHSVIASGIGCIEPRSLVLAPAFGVFFQADRGIYLLTRETGVEYVGASVEDIVREAGNIRAATLLEDRHQVKLVLNRAPTAGVPDPYALTYDYLRKQWSEVDAPAVGSASTARLNEMQGGCAWRGEAGEVLHVFLQSGGLAVERPSDDTTYADTTHTATAGFGIDVTTDWISLAGIAGLKRIREIGITTERVNAGAMSAQYWPERDGDYNDAAQTFAWPSPAPAYLPIRPAVQKTSAFRVRVWESGTVAQTENVTITGLTASVGVKRGLRKIPASQKGV
jgi:hypothetical protein